MKAAFMVMHQRFFKILAWLSASGENKHYDLGIVDEIFAIFAGVTLFVSQTQWLKSHTEIIATIFLAVAMTVVPIVLAINEPTFWLRNGFNTLAIFFALGTVQAAMYVSLDDLAPQSQALTFLPIGVLAWVSIREVSILTLNLLPRKTNVG